MNVTDEDKAFRESIAAILDENDAKHRQEIVDCTKRREEEERNAKLATINAFNLARGEDTPDYEQAVRNTVEVIKLAMTLEARERNRAAVLLISSPIMFAVQGYEHVFIIPTVGAANVPENIRAHIVSDVATWAQSAGLECVHSILAREGLYGFADPAKVLTTFRDPANPSAPMRAVSIWYSPYQHLVAH
jgi:hypothetical protein